MGSINWIDLAQDRDRSWALVKTVMKLQFPSNAGNFLSSLGRFGFSGRTLLYGVSWLSDKAAKPPSNSTIGRVEPVFPLPKRANWFWNAPRILSNGHWKPLSILRECKCLRRRVDRSYLHLVRGLRTRGAIFHPHVPSWRARK
jgi:hypothetical protein